MESPVVQRIQITFGKFGALKYTGNLDIAKIWERVLRRAELPILYTQGFNMRPRFQLATALPLGITSECEILDVSLREELPTFEGLAERIMSVAPDGLKVYAIDEVPKNEGALQKLVRWAKYRIHFEDELEPDRLQQAVDEILARDRILQVKSGKKGRKSYSDLRPLIHDLQIDENGDLIAHLGTGERGNLQPADLLNEMGLGDVFARVHRYELFLTEYPRRN